MTDSTEQRARTLRRLLNGERPLDAAIEAIATLPWDSDEELVTLTPAHVINMLERFVSGEFSTTDIERWADAIEGRDDIALDAGAADPLREVIFELANPSIHAPMTTASARALVTRLRAGSSQG
jgi:hypothetical protein